MKVLPKVTVKLDGIYHKALEPFEIEMESIPLDLQDILVAVVDAEIEEIKVEEPKPSKRQARKNGAKRSKKEETVSEDLIDTIVDDSYLDSLL